MISQLITEAIERYSDISPCSGKKSILDCITYYNEEIQLWFNTSDNSTHLISSKEEKS